jgi:hypothetical protein
VRGRDADISALSAIISAFERSLRSENAGTKHAYKTQAAFGISASLKSRKTNNSQNQQDQTGEVQTMATVQAEVATTSRGSRLLRRILVGAAFLETVFVTVPFFALGIHQANPKDLIPSKITYSFLGEFGFLIAIFLECFAVYLLVPLVLISVVMAIKQRMWWMVVVSLSTVLP